MSRSPRTFHRRHWWTSLAVLALLLAWDATAMDMAAARWFGGAGGFALKEHWLFSAVLHEGGRYAAWVFESYLCLMVWWPAGVFRRIDASRRLQLVVTALAGVVVVASLKALSHTSCPWDLAEFGRAARHVSHWAWASADGGSGRCFPAGHASAGFAFLGGYFALSEQAPAAARAWCIGAVLAGLGFGVAQQVRGAHFMSHTLWTGWICWCVALGFDHLRILVSPSSALAIGAQER